ncbi:MAG: NAD(P)-dependent oxidoreductase [Xanthomonadales bacterium]|nr:NAD(P)-dependent oxidoreductase [Xanthomonadales bacterium]
MMAGALRKAVFLDVESVDNGDLDRRKLSACLPVWEWHAFTAADEVAGRIADADVVISNKCRLDGASLRAARRLSLIAVAATGTNNVDLDAAAAAGITVCNIRDYCSDSVAQHAITLMLNLLTGQPWYWQDVRAGRWSRSRHFSLHSRNIREARGLNFGVVGYGTLGRATAQRSRALGMQLLIAERRGRAPRPGRAAFEETVRKADVLSLHCPLTADTRHLIDREVLSAMKPDALLINTARGEVVHARDLADALRAGLLGGAGIDTLDREPPPVDHPLLQADIPGLLVTPHNAWASRSGRQAALDQLADVVAAHRRGNAINRVL